LKKNLVRQLERFAEWFEDFDLRSGAVHGAHSETVRPARSTPKNTKEHTLDSVAGHTLRLPNCRRRSSPPRIRVWMPWE
jgi:hypothetical protein